MARESKLIFIVDDDQDDIDILEEALLAADPLVEILVAKSGKEALAILKKTSTERVPSLLILDYNMPDITGAQTLQDVSKEDWFDGVTKVVWSTSDATLYEQVCKESGADHYFKKPDSIDEVWKLARKLLLL